MSPKTKIVMRLVSCVAVACALLSNGCPKRVESDHVLTMTLDWRPEPEFGGFYQAKLANNFRDHGITIELKNAGGGAPTWQLVANNQTDFATTSADQVLIARANGADVVALFAVYQISPQGIMVHASRTNVTNMKDVFMTPGTLAAENNAWLKFLLNKFGTPVVKIEPNQFGISTFLAQQDFSQQCFITSEPIQAEHQHSDAKTFLIADEGFNPYVTVLITSGKTMREKPEMVRNVVAACREGWRAYLDDPKAANDMMGSLNNTMDPQTFTDAANAQKRLIETDETRKKGLGTMTLDRWQTIRQQLIDLGRLDKNTAPKAEDCYFSPQ